MSAIGWAVALCVLQACSSPAPKIAPLTLDTSALPAPDSELLIEGLGPCTDAADRTLNLARNEPVVILTHGCFGSSGQFRALAQVFAFQGQQAACFTYDDRASLYDSAAQMHSALQKLSQAIAPDTPITLIAHSQGALIGRHALTESYTGLARATLNLVTVSGPFGGIAAAQPCEVDSWLNILTLGTTRPMCRLATGAKYADITRNAPFIQQAGKLLPNVASYLKINTDERDSCRQLENGRCLEDDFIFSLGEQSQAAIDAAPRTQNMLIKAGHVEIIGDKNTAPQKLIASLQQYGVLRRTSAGQESAFEHMLASVYGDTRLLAVKNRRKLSGVQP